MLPDHQKNRGPLCSLGEAESYVAFMVLAAAVATGTTQGSWGLNIQNTLSPAAVQLIRS